MGLTSEPPRQDSAIGRDRESVDVTPADTIKSYRPIEVGSDLPDTIELRHDPVRGDGLFARRAISILEPAWTLPYSIFMAIETDKLSTTCYSCLAVTSSHIPHIKGTAQECLPLKKCAGCSQVSFCNKECQTKAWNAFHKLECKIFTLYRDNFPPMMIRGVLRIVLLRDKGLLPPLYWNTLMNDLVSHDGVWVDAPENNITVMARDVKFVTKSRMPLETVTKLFWVMRTNSIELPTSVHGGIGTMLDPIFAKLNHSCDANLMLYRPWHTSKSGWNLKSNTELDGSQRNAFATVVPLRDIRQGEELTIFYSDPTMSVKERNVKHKSNYYFECTCSKCNADTKLATKVETTLPVLSAEYEAWSESILRQLEDLQLGNKGGYTSFQKVSKAWDDGLPRYLEYPQLYTASDFDQISLHQSVAGLQLGAFDKTLINLLRPFLLIYPTRIPSRQNYSNVHIMFVMLETLDILLGINCVDGTVDPPKAKDVKKSLKALEGRRFNREVLVHWRQKMCVHLRKCVETSAIRDLLPLLGELQDRMPLQRDFGPGVEAEVEVIRDSAAEDVMRKALGLSEGRWKTVLEEVGW